MGNGVDVWIEAVHVGPDPRGLLFDSWIDLRDGLDLGINRLGRFVDLFEEVGDGIDAEVDPLTEVRVGEVADLQIVASVKARTLTKRPDRVVIETGPAIFPA